MKAVERLRRLRHAIAEVIGTHCHVESALLQFIPCELAGHSWSHVIPCLQPLQELKPAPQLAKNVWRQDRPQAARPLSDNVSDTQSAYVIFI